MTHTITLAEVLPAMDTNIILASSSNSKTKRSKSLKYRVKYQEYVITFFDGVCEVISTCNAIENAIDKYNDCQA